jgi:uncharacterized Zn finger protein
MSWRHWDGWEPAAPRRPADGIKARTQRGKFGATWWAGRWLAALEQLVDAGRLSRGRSYARSGQVTRLEAGPKGIDARVQGSRPTPYKVTIRFRRLTDREWEAVAGAMADQALFAARLLAGEMPEQIEDAFRAAGASLFPAAEGDMETDCSCPDWSNPCKHLAAVFYLLGERFDDDPFLMFELRGRSKEQIVAALRERRATGTAPGASPAVEGDAGPAAGELEDETEPPAPLLPAGADAGAAEAFWLVSASVEELSFRYEPPAVNGLPAKVRGAPPQWPSGVDFNAAAERAYQALAERARRLAADDA